MSHEILGSNDPMAYVEDQLAFCSNCKVFQERAAEAARMLKEQDAQFKAAREQFEARAKTILDTQAQQRRVVAQLQEDLRQARAERFETPARPSESPELHAAREEIGRLNREAQTLQTKLNQAKAEIEKLKGTPCEQGNDPDDPTGILGRFMNLELD